MGDMNLIDSHCHIHSQFEIPLQQALDAARLAGVERMITVGTDAADSQAALDLTAAHPEVYAAIGIHPGAEGPDSAADLEKLLPAGPVALGDIGLDYHYHTSPAQQRRQRELLESLLDLAARHNLPCSFHVREAFADFWSILDNFPSIKGVLHSYTDNLANLERALGRGLMIGVNGILTFNREPQLNQVFQQLPLENLLFETDAPWLTPKPHRGHTNQPAFTREIAEFYAKLRGQDLAEIAKIATANTEKLFNMEQK
jgi:TatD DNase family protein